jgi:hypothetical protein
MAAEDCIDDVWMTAEDMWTCGIAARLRGVRGRTIPRVNPQQRYHLFHPER